ncbi:MAG TPA: NAD(P)-dependent oxidoreductase [Puia sp.]|nr:NAD(P)-dependent oxidoreductase [Puia sp.]
MNNTKLGWIGLGNMGKPMSQRHINAGYPVTVYNRSKEKEAALKAAGAAIAATPAELLKNTDIVFLMVTDDQAIRDIFTAGNGLLAAGVTGKLVVNMSTVSPAISKEFAAACKAQGNDYLDAPVSGSVRQAQDGQLVIMVGGSAAAYEKAGPVFQPLGKLTLHLGDIGAGNTAKLAINLLLSIHTQGLAETIRFAEQHGVKTEDFMNIMNNGAMANFYAKLKGEAIIADNYKPAFALKLIAKDLRLARAEGWNTPMAEVAFQSFQQAQSRFGEEDLIAIKKYLG